MKKSRGKQSNKDFHRRQRALEALDVVFILCEADETEPNYLNWVKQQFKLRSLHILPGRRCGRDPKNLIKSGLGLIDKSTRVWLVFDCDERCNFSDNVRRAKKKKLNVAYSNPCIEFWFLLHFEYTTACNSCIDFTKKLKDYIPNYDKRTLGDITKLEENLYQALENAQKLREYFIDIREDETDNPSTMMDRLIQDLMSLKRI